MYNYGRESWKFAYVSCISQCGTERSKVRLPKRYVQSVFTDWYHITHSERKEVIKNGKNWFKQVWHYRNNRSCLQSFLWIIIRRRNKTGTWRLRKRSGQRTWRSKRNDRYLYRTFSKRQIHRYGWELKRHCMVDFWRIQKRQPPSYRRSLEICKRFSDQRTFQQETFCCRCILRC